MYLNAQIYNEEVRDLLGTDTTAKLSLKEDPGRGVFVKDLSEEVVGDVASINTVMDKGFNNRTVGATLVRSILLKCINTGRNCM